MKKSLYVGTALITGATSGIGRALAHLLAQERYELVLVARNKTLLAQTEKELKSKYSTPVTTIVKDLAEDKTPRDIVQMLKKKKMKIDVLINNAGFGTYGFFPDISLDEEVLEMHVNMLAVTQLTKLFLPDMLC